MTSIIKKKSILSKIVKLVYQAIFIFSVCIGAVGLYYTSLMIENYSQLRQVGHFSNEQITYISCESGKYEFRKEIVMTPERLKFQTHSGRIYLYIAKDKFSAIELHQIYIDIQRTCNGIVDKYHYTYKDLIPATDYFQRDRYYSFELPPLAMYPNFNEIIFQLGGIKLLAPEKEINVSIFFNGHKGQTIFLQMLFNAVLFFVGSIFLLLLAFGIKKFNGAGIKAKI